MKPLFFTLVLLCSLFIMRASAQNYSIDWSKIGAGGGSCTGAVYELSGTIGQHDAAVMTGGTFSLTSGFWSLFATVPAPGTPGLTFILSPTNTILVCWPSSSANFVLQQNPDLGSKNWVSVGAIPADDGVTQCVAIIPTRGTLFFRLKK